MKKILFLLPIMLVFVVALMAQKPPLQNEGFREGRREATRFNRLDNFTERPLQRTERSENIERQAPEKCENCPEEKTEEYVCENVGDSHDCCNGEAKKTTPGNRNIQRGDFSSKLNFTEAQKQKIDALKADHMKANEKRRADLVKLESEKLDAIQNNKSKDAKKIVDKISKIRTELEKSRIDLMISISNELTSEQKEMMNKVRGDKFRGRGRN